MGKGQNASDLRGPKIVNSTLCENSAVGEDSLSITGGNLLRWSSYVENLAPILRFYFNAFSTF